jgi:hypothetical protein
MMNMYRLPISLIRNFETPVVRPYQLVGTTACVKPRTTAFNGNSTVRLK